MGLTMTSTGKGLKDEFAIKRRGFREKIIAVAGNPNVGKSTLFNALTGMHQHTGNWSGKTVGNAVGYLRTKNNNFTLVDIPGTYSLNSHSKEEEIAREFICSDQPDGIIVVCDATCLERSLRLVFQILEVTKNVLICVNLLDEAQKKGIYVDLNNLERELGVRVAGTVARSKKSIKNFTAVLDSMDFSKRPITATVKNLEKFDVLKETENVIKAEKAAKNCIKVIKKPYADFDRRADKILTGKFGGFLIMFAFLMFVFWLTIFGANYLSQGLSFAFSKIENGLIWCLNGLKVSEGVKSFVIEGIWRVPSVVVSVMLPPMAIFFPLFTFLEDVGFLPRIAFNLDSPFKKCKSCGKQALTMCMGFGCNAAGVVGCRIIDSPRERILAVITNSLVPCNGRFPTIIAIISMFFVDNKTVYSAAISAVCLSAVIVVAIIVTFGSTALLSQTVLKGEPSSYTLEMPPFRKPQILGILLRSVFDRTLFVLGRSVTAALPLGVIIWLFANLKIGDSSLLYCFTQILEPLGVILCLDGVILAGFILGLPANEIVMPVILMAYLSGNTIGDMASADAMRTVLVNNGWDIFTAVSVIIFTLFHWPCATTVLTIKKETGSKKWTAIAVFLPTVIGVVLCLGVKVVKTVFF